MLKGFIFITALLPLVAWAQKAPNCSGGQAQANICAARQLEAVDAQLSRIYEGQLKRLRNEWSIRGLQEAQQAWIAFREKDCEYDASATKGGSGHSQWVSVCMTRHTKRRIEDMRKFQKCEENGCPW